MEEIILTGYCRALDQSRMVEVETSGETLTADCAWPDCPHCSSCLIAKQLNARIHSPASAI